MKQIQVSVVEDSEALRRGLATLLDDAPDMQCRSTCADAEEALQRLAADAPDIVLMDIRLPGLSGIECVTRLVARMPKVRILMLTAYEDSEDIFQSLAAGAHGYLVKSTAPEQLLDAIREVAAGGSPISGSVARKMVDFFRTRPAVAGGLVALAPREREVLKLLADGCPYKEIAEAMQVSLGTVRTYIERIYEKLHVHNRTDAVVKFLGHPPPGQRPR
ncbi:MAG: response regulator transcription factor [Verrucomicrobia bacterium]|nr:response regulator transcription factor [Verrucomicrobiota bacterium]